ncbi:short chain dehydrogenase [Hyphomonas oceanitis SCH89]|uniref:Short chain dehydrogenase n=1 Tax=Hyphomonas oceanitis SCH89 TaxID=1280953 RepID=A0A059G1V4_9PROT|nr:short chain dehydrogenase [Hyphomonas oceanitis SCH89]
MKDAEYAKRLVDLAECAFGGLDVGFNNAGIIGDVGPITDMAPENWHDVIAVWSKERNQTAFYGFCTLISGELAQCNYSVKASGRKQLAPPYANSVSADNAS